MTTYPQELDIWVDSAGGIGCRKTVKASDWNYADLSGLKLDLNLHKQIEQATIANKNKNKGTGKGVKLP